MEGLAKRSVVRYVSIKLQTNDSVRTPTKFHLRRSDPELPPMTMDGYPVEEVPCLERILDVKLTPNYTRNYYIRWTAKDTGKMIGSYLILSSIFIRAKSGPNCSHIWTGGTVLSFQSWVEKDLQVLVEELYSNLKPLSRSCDVASISLEYSYFHGNCSDNTLVRTVS